MMRRYLLLCALFPLLAGCLRLEREYPEKSFFSLEATREGAAATAPLYGTLRLEKVRISSPFQGKSFIYRTDGLRYEEDFYSRFVAPPAELLTAETSRWLRASGLFSQLYAGPAPIAPENFLEGHVSALYGDFRGSPGRAVLEIAFTLLQEESPQPRIVLRREYRCEISLPKKTPADLAAGWSEALAQVLAELERDIMERKRRDER